MTFVILGTCENTSPPGVSIHYFSNILNNGRYPHATGGELSCPDGFTLYGIPVQTIAIQCREGCWAEPVEKFRCIPSDQGELNFKSLHSHQGEFMVSSIQRQI